MIIVEYCNIKKFWYCKHPYAEQHKKNCHFCHVPRGIVSIIKTSKDGYDHDNTNKMNMFKKN